MDKAKADDRWELTSTMVPRVEGVGAPDSFSSLDITIVGNSPDDEEPLVTISGGTLLCEANTPEGRYVWMDDLRKLARATAEYDKLLKKNKEVSDGIFQ